VNRSLKTLFGINGIFVFALSLFGPLYAAYVGFLNNGVLAVSLSYSVMLATTTIATLGVANWGDRVKKKEWLLAIGFLLRSLAWFGLALTSHYWQLITMLVIIGLGEALGTPAFEAIFADHLIKRVEIKEFSLWKLSSNILSVLGTLIGGLIVLKFGFQTLFLLMSILALGCFVATVTLPKRLL